MHLHNYYPFCINSYFFTQNRICTRCPELNNWSSSIKNKCYENSSVKTYCLSKTRHTPSEWISKALIVDKFIAVSHFVKDTYVKMGIPENKIEVIYNPVENFISNPDNEIMTNKKYILYIGALIDQKGLLTLLKAAKLLPQINFVIAGAGRDKEKYLNLAKKMNNVEFVGIVSGNIKQDLIKNSQFVIVPSEWWETFGIVVLEANSLGKIVLTSGLGGLSELIENGVNGFTFTPGDYLNLKAKIELIVDELKSNSHNKESINKMSMFTPEIFIKQMHQLYKSIL